VNILADHTAVQQCPTWCAADIPAHISAEQVVEATAGPESHRIFVSLEQENTPAAQVVVRLQGANDTPMSPAQAIQLGQALIASAFAAVSR
jgi:hypothetical protein